MTLDFPNSPTDSQIFTDAIGQNWIYDAAVNSWTVLGKAGYTGDVVVDGKTLTFADGILQSVA